MTEEYTLSELKKLLEGTEPEQIAWRVDPKNKVQVSRFVELYAAMPGGRNSSYISSKLRAEPERA